MVSFLFPELLGSRVEDCMQFVGLVYFTFSIAVVKFPLFSAVGCCTACIIASPGVTVEFVMYFCLNYTLSDTILDPVAVIHTL